MIFPAPVPVLMFHRKKLDLETPDYVVNFDHAN